MRLIDADELKERAHEMILEDPDAFNGGWSYDAVTVEEIDESPTIEAAPVVHGEWMQTVEDIGLDVIFCSHCEKRWNIFDNDTQTFNFCPNCGAKMRTK